MGETEKEKDQRETSEQRVRVMSKYLAEIRREFEAIGPSPALIQCEVCWADRSITPNRYEATFIEDLPKDAPVNFAEKAALKCLGFAAGVYAGLMGFLKSARDRNEIRKILMANLGQIVALEPEEGGIIIPGPGNPDFHKPGGNTRPPGFPPRFGGGRTH